MTVNWISIERETNRDWNPSFILSFQPTIRRRRRRRGKKKRKGDLVRKKGGGIIGVGIVAIGRGIPWCHEFQQCRPEGLEPTQSSCGMFVGYGRVFSSLLTFPTFLQASQNFYFNFLTWRSDLFTLNSKIN
jgi:hypothetical protein